MLNLATHCKSCQLINEYILHNHSERLKFASKALSPYFFILLGNLSYWPHKN